MVPLQGANLPSSRVSLLAPLASCYIDVFFPKMIQFDEHNVEMASTKTIPNTQ